MTDFNDMLSKTKTAIMLTSDTAFISAFMLGTEITICSSVKTGSTDGISIKINPDFFAGLIPSKRKFLILHELYHILYLHPLRLGNRDLETWTKACDYVINIMLVDGKFDFIEGGLLDTKYRGMTVEQVYDLLMENPEDSEPQGGIGDDIEPDGEMSQTDIDTQQVKVAMRAMKAVNAAKAQGKADTIPDGVQEILHDIVNPQLPWHELLYRHMNQKAKNKQSWFKRNRRVRSPYLPSKLGKRMGEIQGYLDASGSISLQELSLEVKEMKYIQELVNPSKFSLFAFSHYLGEEQVFSRNEEIDFVPDARGGTSLVPVWDNIKKTVPKVAVIFTDGYVTVPPSEGISTDIIFVIVNNPSWVNNEHTVIHMSINND